MAISSDDVSNSVHPENGRTVCKEYGVGDDEYSLDAGFVPEEDVVVGELPSSDDGQQQQQQQQPQPQLLPTPSPTPLGTTKGDGTPCSGSKCPLDGMCRNQAGLCGSTIAFCNPNNVWDSSCPDKVITRSPTKSPTVAAQSNAPSRSSSPTLSIHPSFVPTMSLHPTQSNSPTISIRTTTSSNDSICNQDGSHGVTTVSTNEDGSYSSTVVVQPTELSYTYALRSTNNVPTVSLLDEFEEELERRLACVYFDTSDAFGCLTCDEDEQQQQQQQQRVIKNRRQLRSLMEVEDSTMMGIASWPVDVPNPVEGK